jgi:hypothetical protein
MTELPKVPQSNIESIEDILNRLDNHTSYLTDNIIALTPEKAKELLLDIQQSSKLTKTLIELQTLHSLILRYHPEEIYSSSKDKIRGTEDTVYNILIGMSEDNSTLIDYAIRLFQYFSSRARTLSYGITSKTCFNWLTSSLDEYMSFQTAISLILSNINKLQPYFRYLRVSEKEKGVIEAQKTKGFGGEYPTSLPEPPKKSEAEKK